MTAATDVALYERWLTARDASAFAELARLHAPVVYDLALRYSGDAALAEDLVQEALLDLALAGTRKPADVGVVAWLARFAICRARNARSSERSRTRRQRVVGAARREDAMPDDRLERDDELEHALSRAAPGERVVLAMRYLHEWEYDRIAASLGISEGAARVRVHRALGSLRERLGVDASDGTCRAPSAGRGATLPGALAALPLSRMPDGLVDLAVDRALRAAEAAAAGAGAASSAAPAARLSLHALGLSTLLVVTVASGLTFLGDTPSARDLHVAARPIQAPLVASVPATTRATTPPTDRRGGVPRPPEWDRGELARLRTRARATDESVPTAGAGGAAPTLPAAADPAAAFSPSLDVLRPIQRGVRAATCDLVSSDGERAGTSEGRTPVIGTRVGADARTATVAESREVAPGLPPELDADPARAPRALRSAPRRLDDLAPEQTELLRRAAALLREIVGPSVTESPEPLGRRELSAHARKLRRDYRAARRELRQAAATDDTAEFVGATARLSQTVSAQRVVRLLMTQVLPGADAADSVDWPEGADLTATLEEVVAILGTLLPDGAAGDGAAAPAGETDLLPDGALPQGRRP